MASPPTPPKQTKNKLFALTICAYRKPGMDEDAYHRYTSETHARYVKELLVKKKIVGYTMQHNTTTTRAMMAQIFGNLPECSLSDCDCFIQIVFRDVQDYIAVKEDPQYKEVIAPDHANFADMSRTTMVTGWLDTLVVDGEVV